MLIAKKLLKLLLNKIGGQENYDDAEDFTMIIKIYTIITLTLLYIISTIQIKGDAKVTTLLEETLIDKNLKPYKLLDKGMLTGADLVLAEEFAASMETPSFKFRLIIQRYSQKEKLILRLDNNNELIIKMLSFNPHINVYSMAMRGELFINKSNIIDILSKLKSDEFDYLSNMDNKTRMMAESLGEALYTLEYYKDGKYKVIDWFDLSTPTLKKISKHKEFKHLNKPLKEYQSIISNIVELSKLSDPFGT